MTCSCSLSGRAANIAPEPAETDAERQQARHDRRHGQRDGQPGRLIGCGGPQARADEHELEAAETEDRTAQQNCVPGMNHRASPVPSVGSVRPFLTADCSLPIVGDRHGGRNIAARYVKLPPMFEITFLGTAASVPTMDRGLSSLLVEHGRHRFLIDCGEGTQRQLMTSGLGFRRLDKVLLTHGHLDHLLGLGGLAGTLNLWRSTDRLAIHAGPAPLRLARRLLEDIVWPDGPPRMRLDWVELSAGPVFTVPDLKVSAFPVRHAAPDCFGFLFEETPRQPLNGERLAELGVPEGEERGLLARGQAVTLADGRRVEPEEVLGPERRGTRIAVVGDCESTDDLLEHVRGVDLLVIEATFLNADADKAEARSHLTVGQATAAGAGRRGRGALAEPSVQPVSPGEWWRRRPGRVSGMCGWRRISTGLRLAEGGTTPGGSCCRQGPDIVRSRQTEEVPMADTTVHEG